LAPALGRSHPGLEAGRARTAKAAQAGPLGEVFAGQPGGEPGLPQPVAREGPHRRIFASAGVHHHRLVAVLDLDDAAPR
jgi:hypothetical protein